MPEIRAPRSIGLAVGLVIQIIVAVCVFLAIGAAAVVLNFAIDVCEIHKLVPSWVIFGMQALETLLWFVDVACCVLLVFKEAQVFVTTLLQKGE